MANRMTNLELSESIKNYIKELFDNDITFLLEENNKIINELKNTVNNLEDKISNFNTINIKDNVKSYADIVNTELENNIINTINDTISNNLKSMNEINARSKTIILHNVKEIIHDDKKTKYDEEFKTVSNILETISSIKIIKMHRIGKIDIDEQVHAYKVRLIQIILNTENKKIDILDNAFRLKNTIYNKIGISHEFDKNQLNTQKKLLSEAKDKSSDTIVYKVKFINNTFKMIKFNIISETNNDLP